MYLFLVFLIGCCFCVHKLEVVLHFFIQGVEFFEDVGGRVLQVIEEEDAFCEVIVLILLIQAFFFLPPQVTQRVFNELLVSAAVLHLLELFLILEERVQDWSLHIILLLG
jgi:hypothetical protein